MGWCDVIAGVFYEWDVGIYSEPARSWAEQQAHDPENAMFYETFAGCAHKALISMPAPDRIALARELLAGTGRVVARDVGEQYLELDDNRMWCHGWNACRAAMMQDRDGDAT